MQLYRGKLKTCDYERGAPQTRRPIQASLKRGQVKPAPGQGAFMGFRFNT